MNSNWSKDHKIWNASLVLKCIIVLKIIHVQLNVHSKHYFFSRVPSQLYKVYKPQNSAKQGLTFVVPSDQTCLEQLENPSSYFDPSYPGNLEIGRDLLFQITAIKAKKMSTNINCKKIAYCYVEHENRDLKILQLVEFENYMLIKTQCIFHVTESLKNVHKIVHNVIMLRNRHLALKC